MRCSACSWTMCASLTPGRLPLRAFHEEGGQGVISAAISSICRAALACMGYPDASVSVDFDDFIIADTDSDKSQMLAEVSAGLVLGWMYLQRFYG